MEWIHLVSKWGPMTKCYEQLVSCIVTGQIQQLKCSSTNLFLTYATRFGRRFRPSWQKQGTALFVSSISFTFYIFVILPDDCRKCRPKHVAYMRKEWMLQRLSCCVGLITTAGITVINTTRLVWRCMHRASSCNMYTNQQDAQNSCD